MLLLTHVLGSWWPTDPKARTIWAFTHVPISVHHPPDVGRVVFQIPVRVFALKLSVGVTSHPHLLEIEGLLTQGSRPGPTSGESVGGMFEMDSSDWSSGIQYHTFVTRSDIEFADPRARWACAAADGSAPTDPPPRIRSHRSAPTASAAAAAALA